MLSSDLIWTNWRIFLYSCILSPFKFLGRIWKYYWIIKIIYKKNSTVSPRHILTVAVFHTFCQCNKMKKKQFLPSVLWNIFFLHITTFLLLIWKITDYSHHFLFSYICKLTLILIFLIMTFHKSNCLRLKYRLDCKDIWFKKFEFNVLIFFKKSLFSTI